MTERKPVPPMIATGFVLCGVNWIAALFLGDWRLVPTGVIVLLMCAATAGVWRNR